MRVALVTGSAKRLGRAIIERLSADGYTVWIHYLTSEAEAIELQSAVKAEGGTAFRVQADVGTEAGIRSLVEAVRDVSGRLDVLVNNVGRYDVADVLEYSREDFDATLQTNLVGPFELCRAARSLFPDDGGSIVNLGYSGLGALPSSPDNLAYVISKTGLLLATKTLAERLGEDGIRVNMVSPGQLDISVDLPSDFDEVVPLGRAGTVQDVASAVSWLVSDEASYVTGQNLEIAGGYMLGLRDEREGPM